MPDRRRAWARALFLAAPDRESRSAFADALNVLSVAIETDSRMRDALSDPAGDRKAKVALLTAALGTRAGTPAKSDAGAAVFERFCALLVEKGRTPLLSQIARSYGALRDADEGIARLDIEAARQIDPPTLERIGRGWSAYSGAKSTRTTLRVNSALIAGYRLRAGSLRIDYSVAGRLERLRRELSRPLGSAVKVAGTGGLVRGEG